MVDINLHNLSNGACSQASHLDVVDELQVAQVPDADEGLLGCVEIQPLEGLVSQGFPVPFCHPQTRHRIRIPAWRNVLYITQNQFHS